MHTDVSAIRPSRGADVFSGHDVGAGLESDGEDEVGDDDRNSLEHDGLEAPAVQILDDLGQWYKTFLSVNFRFS